MKVRVKAKMQVTGAQPGIFRGRTDFLEWGHFDKHFICNIAPQGKFLVFFLQDTFKIALQLRV